MKTFREHINEDVTLGSLTCGGISIDRDSVRDEINAILSAVSGHACVTPYGTLNKIRKALAYFHIHLPKKVYLEGKHGVEVWEVNQFGEKMGVNDQGEWISEVPNKYFLYMHYHLMGSMYYTDAKIVDEKELETRLTNIEKMVSEEMDAASRQGLAKAIAPKEDQHTALGDCDCSQGDSPSTKKAIKVSMKKIDEASTEKLIRYRNKAGEGREKGAKLAYAKLTGKAKVPATMPKHSYMEEDKDPCWKGYEMVGMKKKGGRKVPNCVPVKEEEQIDEVSKKVLSSYIKKASDSRASNQADYGRFEKFKNEKKMGKAYRTVINRRTGIQRAADKLAKEEAQIDEVSAGLARRATHHAFVKSDKMKADAKKEPDMHSYVQAVHKGEKKSKQGTKFAKYAAKKMEEAQIDEKAPPGAKFERMVKHIKKGYSKDGLTTKEKSIAYATAWKAKKRESKD